MSLLR
jgi:hypothetical protein